MTPRATMVLLGAILVLALIALGLGVALGQSADFGAR